MTFVEWNDGMSVGVAEIDDQHKRFVEMMNGLYEDVEEGMGQEGFIIGLAEMVQYAAIHFASEEKYMVKFDYPGYKKHREEHLLFFSKIISFLIESDKARVQAYEMLRFLLRWYGDHIMHTDKEYSDFFRKHGLR